MAADAIERVPPGECPQTMPEPVPGKPGLFRVDATWGTIQPMRVADGVRTVGEAEVVAHLESGGRVIDARSPDEYAAGTIPGAGNVPHREAASRVSELDPGSPSVIFCNGPQCGQSPDAIRRLLDAGHPPGMLLYYRGGLHDWLTLGLPLVQPG